MLTLASTLKKSFRFNGAENEKLFFEVFSVKSFRSRAQMVTRSKNKISFFVRRQPFVHEILEILPQKLYSYIVY